MIWTAMKLFWKASGGLVELAPENATGQPVSNTPCPKKTGSSTFARSIRSNLNRWSLFWMLARNYMIGWIGQSRKSSEIAEILETYDDATAIGNWAIINGDTGEILDEGILIGRTAKVRCVDGSIILEREWSPDRDPFLPQQNP